MASLHAQQFEILVACTCNCFSSVGMLLFNKLAVQALPLECSLVPCLVSCVFNLCDSTASSGAATLADGQKANDRSRDRYRMHTQQDIWESPFSVRCCPGCGTTCGPRGPAETRKKRNGSGLAAALLCRLLHAYLWLPLLASRLAATAVAGGRVVVVAVAVVVVVGGGGGGEVGGGGRSCIRS